MKLHSDFHDYYDTAVGFGVDENVHYNRFTRTLEEQNLNLKLDFPPYRHGNPLLLGFCGQIYPLLQVVKYDDDHKPKFIYYTYSYEEYFARMMKTEEVIEQLKSELWWLGRKQTEKEIKKQLTKRLTKEKIKSFFTDWRRADDAIFLEFKVPVWLVNLGTHKLKITLNPQLAELDFERIKDANEAFQEISMYVANILVEQKETAPVDDIYRIEQHGFDLKTSFRREKRP